MASPYLGEIRMFGGNFAPAGWSTCDGQLVAIADNDALFTLIGTTYGGDGQTTFALPNLAARVPVHMGNNGTSTYVLAQTGGVTNVTLTAAQMPAHTHPVAADGSAANTTSGNPANAFYGNTTPHKTYSAGANAANLHPMMTLPSQGGSQPHDNMQPFLTVTFIIAINGIFPSAT